MKRSEGWTEEYINEFKGNSYAVCSSILSWKELGYNYEQSQQRLMDEAHIYGPFIRDNQRLKRGV